MNEKPEALRLAERIDLRDYYDFDAALHCPDAAIELRRLHAENERLRDELRQSSIDITRAEVERLKAENERLREALNRFEYSSDGHIKRYPEEEVIAALRREET